MGDNARSPDDRGSTDRFDALYRELRSIAARLFVHERTGHTLQPTAAAHEAWLRLSASDAGAFGDSVPFPRLVTSVRRVLVDHARRRDAVKRGGGVRAASIEPGDAVDVHDPLALVTVSDALDRLAAAEPRAAAIFELRVFGGCSVSEAAAIVHRSGPTAERDFRLACAWLRRELAEA